MTTLKAIVGVVLFPLMLVVWLCVFLHGLGLGVWETVFGHNEEEW